MAHFVVGDDLSLLLAHNPVFLFFSHQNLFHRVKQVLLRHVLSAVLYRIDGSFVDHIGKIRAHCAAGGKGNRIQVDAHIQMNVLGMHL